MSPTRKMIEKTRGVCGGKARIAGTRIPVWGLEECRRRGLSEIEIIERYPVLKRQHLSAAWNYVDTHRSEIERQLQENGA